MATGILPSIKIRITEIMIGISDLMDHMPVFLYYNSPSSANKWFLLQVNRSNMTNQLRLFSKSNRVLTPLPATEI